RRRGSAAGGRARDDRRRRHALLLRGEDGDLARRPRRHALGVVREDRRQRPVRRRDHVLHADLLRLTPRPPPATGAPDSGRERPRRGPMRSVCQLAAPTLAPMAASTTAAIPSMPRAFGWTGAAAFPGMSGSTQRTLLLRQASRPMLGV